MTIRQRRCLGAADCARTSGGIARGTRVAIDCAVRSVLAAVFASSLAACQSSEEPREGVLHACPPAPFPVPYGAPCDFSATHTYSPPSVAKGHIDCNWVSCFCDNGVVQGFSTLIGCGPITLSRCGPLMQEGEPCVRWAGIENEICLADYAVFDAEGTTAGPVCSCDEPGPIWRCLVMVGDPERHGSTHNQISPAPNR